MNTLFDDFSRAPHDPSSFRELVPQVRARPGSNSALAAVYTAMLARADIAVDGGRPWDLRVHEPRLWRRLLLHGSRGLGDAYGEGWWDVERLDEFFARIVAHRIARRAWTLPRRLFDHFAGIGDLQGIRRAHAIATRQHGLDTALYRAMLGPGMVHTGAYWQAASTLDQAQRDKLALVCRKLDLQAGMRVLDLGCGWGGFARYAATHHGVEVTGLTRSARQAAYGRGLCRGLPVLIESGDHRCLHGRYDRIVSLDLFERVGPRRYRDHLRLVRDHLCDDGIFVMQTVGLTDAGAHIDPWTTRELSLERALPRVTALGTAMAGTLKLEDWHNLGPDYERTLMAWHDNFSARWPHLAERFSPAFHRQWRYYLLMLAGVFRARALDLWQLVLTPVQRTAQYRRPLA